MSMDIKPCLTALRLWLEPDRDYPMFMRLAWDRADVSIRDVLMDGVHPWTEKQDGADVHPSLIDAFVQRLNEDCYKVPELDSLGYGHNVAAQHGYYYEKKTRFERTLEHIRKNVYFVDELSYLELLDIAKERLRKAWCHSVARTLAERMCPGFQELRRFLKSKDKNVKLSSRDDVDRYDLDEVVSLEDFNGHENLLIAEAVPSLNFRKICWLNDVTDTHGRLRLVPGISKVTLTSMPKEPDYVHVVWHVVLDGEVCRFRPDIGKSDVKRGRAQGFAETWRVGKGQLCFSTDLGHVAEMLEQEAVVPSFPTLNYTYEYRGPTATAEVPYNHVSAFIIGGFYDSKSNSETLKEVLREYGVPMTGTKAKLLQKLAKLAAKQYEERKPHMDQFFTEHRFVRIKTTPSKSVRLPILEDAPLLRNMLLTMYSLTHLRGSAILDPNHKNSTYTEEQLALALVTGKVSFSGAFLRVV